MYVDVGEPEVRREETWRTPVKPANCAGNLGFCTCGQEYAALPLGEYVAKGCTSIRVVEELGAQGREGSWYVPKKACETGHLKTAGPIGATSGGVECGAGDFERAAKGRGA